MKLIFRPIATWPGVLLDEDARQNPQFTATWSDTLEVLDREVWHLGAEEAVIQVAAGERAMRLDGGLRADAKPEHPGVILSLDSKHGPLRYATDLFKGRNIWRPGRSDFHMPGWQANARAIALGLEALRKVDRYGISKGGEQYAGWKAIGGGTPMGPGTAMTVDEAWDFMAEAAGVSDRQVLHQLLGLSGAYRKASKRLHPDVGGDPAAFRRLTEAYELLRDLGGAA